MFVVIAGCMIGENATIVLPISARFSRYSVFDWLFTGKIGQFIGRVSERNVLSFKYMGQTVLLMLYGLFEGANIAALCDRALIFRPSNCDKTYFPKGALPHKIAVSAGVNFSINHIATAVFPVLLAKVWIVNALWGDIRAVFAGYSLLQTMFSPYAPKLDIEFLSKEKPLAEQVR